MLWVLIRNAWWGTSNEYPQHLFSKQKKNTILKIEKKKASYQKLWVKASFFEPALLA